MGDAEESPGNLVTVQTDSVVLERGLRVCNFNKFSAFGVPGI